MKGGLPPSWSTVTLGSVATVVRGVTYKKADASDVPREGYVPLLRSGSIQTQLLTHEKLVYVPRALVKDTQMLRAGDVVVSTSNSRELVGKAAQLTDVWDGTFGAFCSVVRPAQSVHPRFVGLFLRSPAYRNAVSTLSAATNNIANIRAAHLEDMELALPPLAEQERIVDVVEAALSRVDDGARLFMEARRGASDYRAAMLRDALDGPWDRVPLRDVLLSLRNGIFVSRPAREPPGIPIYRISAVRPMELNQDDIRYAPTDLMKYESYLVQADDLLFTRYSGNPEYVGACARVPATATPALHPDKLIRGVVDKSVADPSFLELACSGGATWQEIRANRKTTAGQVGISGTQLASVTVPLPSLEVQREIAEACHQQLHAARNLEADLRRSLGDAETLKRAVLHFALTGQLVPTVPADGSATDSVLAQVASGGISASATPKSARPVLVEEYS